MQNYLCYHLHSRMSILDSTTKFEDYADLAASLGMKSICVTEHGVTREWVSNLDYAKSVGLKYIFGVEGYTTPTLDKTTRIGQHVVLIAKNEDGRREINRLIFESSKDDHFYYVNRFSYDELLNLSDNVIITSACLASPLNHIDEKDPYFERLIKRFDYLEVQPHNVVDQIRYNQKLLSIAEQYNKKLVAGTDTHYIGDYDRECRTILKRSKNIEYADEDSYDLSFRTYDRLCRQFDEQGALPDGVWKSAIENTLEIEELTQPIEIDRAPKYPIIHGSPEADEQAYIEKVERRFKENLESGRIPLREKETFENQIAVENEVFSKLKMCGFILSQSEITDFMTREGIVKGYGRGSVCGSAVAFVLGITDVDSVRWNTVFARFASENRINSVGDIDIDIIDSDRPKVFEYMIKLFGAENTARVPSLGRIQELSAIDDIARSLAKQWTGDADENPYSIPKTKAIKEEYKIDPDETRKKYPEIFKYFDGLIDCPVSLSVHPAGMIAAPSSVVDLYGCVMKDGLCTSIVDMSGVSALGGTKYDWLILGNIGIIKDTCEYAGIPYPSANDIDFDDADVYKDMLRTNIGLFQFTSPLGKNAILKYKPQSIMDLNLITAAIRPSGASYRDAVLNHEHHQNPSRLIDEILNPSGYLVFQEEIIAFLQKICGFSGGDADDIRRAISKKKASIIEKAIPKIIDGYCSKSDKPREVAEKEVADFIKTIEDSSGYSFGYNHSQAYSMISYTCAYFRYYYPLEFCAAYLNNAANDEDLANGAELASLYGISVLPPRYGKAKATYAVDKDSNTITKGVAALKGLNVAVSDALYDYAQTHHIEYFSDLLCNLPSATGIHKDQLDALIGVDYFRDFGNIPTLRTIKEFCEFMKYGDAKSISKAKAGDYTRFIAPHAVGITKAGKESASWNQLDVLAILHDFEAYQRTLGTPDLKLTEKAELQKQYMGYVDMTTGFRSDKNKVIVVSKVTPLLSKKDGTPWAYAADFKSIGTGRTVRASIRSGTFEALPFKEGDAIEVNAMSMNKKGYWSITSYNYYFG